MSSSPSSARPVSMTEVAEQMKELEAHFDKQWRAREETLRALEGRDAPPTRVEPATAPVDRDEVIGRCRDQARQLVKDELAAIDRELNLREWQLSPRTVKVRHDEERLRALEAELGSRVGDNR